MMRSREEKSDRTWRIASRAAIAVVLLGAGYRASYWTFGDAVELREILRKQQIRIDELEWQDLDRFPAVYPAISPELRKCRADLEECWKLRGLPPHHDSSGSR